jgi:hypothetical protein
MRAQLEQERLEFERRKAEERGGLQSERGKREALEEVHSKKELMTARGRRKELDAVRES